MQPIRGSRGADRRTARGGARRRGPDSGEAAPNRPARKPAAPQAGGPIVAALVDAVLVLTFVAVGRRTHDEALLGILATAWPFLAGLLVGWLVVLATRRTYPHTVLQGVPVWVCTVAGGMMLRRLIGAGTALPFVLVATLTLAVFLLGWRLVASALTR